MQMERQGRFVEEGAHRVYDGLKYFLERTVGSKVPAVCYKSNNLGYTGVSCALQL